VVGCRGPAQGCRRSDAPPRVPGGPSRPAPGRVAARGLATLDGGSVSRADLGGQHRTLAGGRRPAPGRPVSSLVCGPYASGPVVRSASCPGSKRTVDDRDGGGLVRAAGLPCHRRRSIPMQGPGPMTPTLGTGCCPSVWWFLSMLALRGMAGARPARRGTRPVSSSNLPRAPGPRRTSSMSSPGFVSGAEDDVVDPAFVPRQA